MKFASRSGLPILALGLCLNVGVAFAQASGQGAKSQLARTELAKTELAKTELAKTDPAKTEPAKSNPAKNGHAGAGRAAADSVKGPSFRRGLWHFVRTMDLLGRRTPRQRLLEREMTACVDPTQAMKATFSSPSVGSCVSDRPEKIDNKYVFANRCDYMGPVSTIITVDSEEAYTEQNQIDIGGTPKVELVVARRIGDCRE